MTNLPYFHYELKELGFFITCSHAHFIITISLIFELGKKSPSKGFKNPLILYRPGGEGMGGGRNSRITASNLLALLGSRFIFPS